MSMAVTSGRSAPRRRNRVQVLGREERTAIPRSASPGVASARPGVLAAAGVPFGSRSSICGSAAPYRLSPGFTVFVVCVRVRRILRVAASGAGQAVRSPRVGEPGR